MEFHLQTSVDLKLQHPGLSETGHNVDNFCFQTEDFTDCSFNREVNIDGLRGYLHLLVLRVKDLVLLRTRAIVVLCRG